jgi:cleavage and polyadenylation specificity factor subunit 1
MQVSILFWEAPLHSLTTLSIHFYERENLKSPFPDGTPPHLLRDHASRCLLMRFYTDVYAILPIRQPDDDIDEMTDFDLEKKPYYPSFVVTANQIDKTLAHIRDECFLHEYREPTLAILYSGTSTGSGLLDLRKDTVTLLAVTLDLQQRASTTIFTVPGLPYDCFRVISLPSPTGGLLVLGTNQLIHVDQAGRCVAVGVNIYARRSTAFPMTQRPELELRLEGATPIPIHGEDSDILLGLRDGTFIRCRFLRDGRNVTDMDIERVDLSKIPNAVISGYSCAASLDDERVFFGSQTGDSLLLGYSSQTRRDASVVKIGMNDTVDDLAGIYGDEDEEASLPAVKGKLRLQIHDFLMNTAPIRDAILATPLFSEVVF